MTMKHLVKLVLLSSFSSSVLAINGVDDKAYEGTWVQPNESDIPANAEGDRIRYGKALLTDTYKYLGAESVIGKPHTGNRLSCSNCHLNAGMAAYSSPWVVSYYKYDGAGQFSSRTNENLTLPKRINGCIERSLHGTALDEQSEEMQAMIAYFKWLATGMRVDNWTQVIGTGFLPVADMPRAADPARGQGIYMQQCADCHGADGQGEWDAQQMRFETPAVWGPDSFNSGAGMNRLRTGVRFIKGTMPFEDVDPLRPSTQLSDEDAWDVMAYVLSQDRPIFTRQESDYSGIGPDGVPNWMRKNVDAAYPIYYPRSDRTDNINLPAMFPPEQHKYGPWQDMLRVQQEIRDAFEASR